MYQQHQQRRLFPFAIGFSLAMVFALAAVSTLSFIGAMGPQGMQPLTQDTFINVARKIQPTVVSITVNGVNEEQMAAYRQRFDEQNKQQDQLREFLRDWPFGQGSVSPFGAEGGQFNEDWFKYRQIGSGVIVRDDGHILTNSHVLGDAKPGQITVTLQDGRRFTGDDVKVVERDSLTDLAVLKVNGKGLPEAKWADSDKIQPGQWVLAVGDPLELRNSVTQGIISASGRDIGNNLVRKYIQTTAIINPGNSGGALVDLDGRVVGINVAISTQTGLWSGVGFAIPSNRARMVAEDIIEYKKVRRGYLGVTMLELNPEVKEHFKFEGQGVLVDTIVQAGQDGATLDGPALKAGLKVNDIIAEIDGLKMNNTNQLLREITEKRVGETIKLKVFRDGDDQTIRVKLVERPSDEELLGRGQEAQLEQKKEEAEKKKELGIEIEGQAPPKQQPSQRVILRAVKPGSAWEKAGVRPGDEIFEVNGIRVNVIEDIEKAMEGDEESSLVKIFRVNRDGEREKMVKVVKAEK